MLAQIVDTPSRAKVATFFLSATHRAFHAEEIRKTLSETGATISSALKHLSKNGLVRSVERGGELYYRLNSRYPYLEELSGFLVKKGNPQYKDVVLSEFEKLNHTELVVLTGLFTGQVDMPTDVVIVGSPTAGSVKKVIEKVEKEIRQEIYYSVFSPKEFQERVDMFERFTRDLFDNPHLVVLDKRDVADKQSSTVSKKTVKKSIRIKKA